MTWCGYWRNFIRTNMGKYLDNWMGLISVVSTPVYAGQRQGCVLSPHFFCAVLQEGIRQWRRRVEQHGNRFEGWHAAFVGSEYLVMILNWYYLIFLIAKASEALIYLLDMSVDTLGGVGLWLHVSKTVILTTETQTPPFLTNWWTSQNERGPKLRVTKPVMRKNYRFRFIYKVLQPIRGLWNLILGSWMIYIYP